MLLCGGKFMLKSRIKWCYECNVPVLSRYCGLCGKMTYDCASDLKPTFDKERELFRKILKVDIPPLSFRYRNRIISNGETYLIFRTVKGTLVISRGPKRNCEHYDAGRDFLKRLIKANEDFLRKKETKAVEFIKRTREKFPSSKFVVLFGGGKDSAVTAMLAKKALRKVPLLFIDTTLEFPETYEFVERFSKVHDFILLRNKEGNFYRSSKDFFQLCKRLGPPSIYCRWCCHIFKEQPVREFINDEKDNNIIFLSGIRRLESRRRKNYSPLESGKKIRGQVLVQPILDWRDLEVWLYILWKRIEINELYKLGHSRVGCWVCPCTPPIMDVIRRITHYQLWAKFEKILIEYANENGRSEHWVKDSLWRLRRPKRQKYAINPISVKKDGKDILFLYKLPCKSLSLDHFKIIGNLETYDEKSFTVKSDFIQILGKFYEKFTELNVRYAMSNYMTWKGKIEKLIARSMNCIGCGSCTTSCSRGARKVKDNSIIITEKCNKCKLCLETPCAVENSEEFFTINMNPFIISMCERGLNMNHIIFFDNKLGQRVAESLRSANVNVEIHENGEVICVSSDFPRRKLEKLVARYF